MNGPVPSRRAMLRSLAALPLAAVPAVIQQTMASEGVSPDPIIRRLVEEYDVCALHENRTLELLEAAEDRYQHPEPPEALFRQHSDFRFLFGFKGAKHHSGRQWYGSQEAIDFVASYNPDHYLDPDLRQEIIARRDEIVSAWGELQATTKRAEVSAGLDVANADYDVASAAMIALRHRIIETVSPDPALQALRIRAILDRFSVERWRSGLDDLVHFGILREGGPWEDALAASIVRDLIIARQGVAHA